MNRLPGPEDPASQESFKDRFTIHRVLLGSPVSELKDGPLDAHTSIAHFLNLSLLLPCNADLPFPEPQHCLLQCSPFYCLVPGSPGGCNTC